MSGLQLRPGVPIAALAVVCPALAAVILLYRDRGLAGAGALLARSLDYRRMVNRAWFVPLVLLLPAVSAASFFLLRAGGVSIPIPHVTVAETLGLFGACFIAGLAEELGWSGYALRLLQRRSSALGAAFVLGLVWAAWHIVPLLQAHRAPGWIAWWCLGTVALRIVMVWLYNNAGKSVFAITVFHALSNVCWQLFPIHGSYFDPRVNALLMLGIAGAIIVIAGPQTLTMRRSR